MDSIKIASRLRFVLAGYFLGMGIEQMQLMADTGRTRLNAHHSYWPLEIIVPIIEVFLAACLFWRFRGFILISLIYIGVYTVAVILQLATVLKYDVWSLMHHSIGASNDWCILIALSLQVASNLTVTGALLYVARAEQRI